MSCLFKRLDLNLNLHIIYGTLTRIFLFLSLCFSSSFTRSAHSLIKFHANWMSSMLDLSEVTQNLITCLSFMIAGVKCILPFELSISTRLLFKLFVPLRRKQTRPSVALPNISKRLSDTTIFSKLDASLTCFINLRVNFNWLLINFNKILAHVSNIFL